MALARLMAVVLKAPLVPAGRYGPGGEWAVLVCPTSDADRESGEVALNRARDSRPWWWKFKLGKWQ